MCDSGGGTVALSGDASALHRCGERPNYQISVMISECARKHRVAMVQSSPVLAGEEEEWGSEGEVDRASSEGVKQASTPSEPDPPPATPPQPPASPVPKLRLNTSLATDPALRVPPLKPEPPASPADLEYLASLPSALQTAIVAGRLFCVPPPAESPAPAPRKPDSAENRQGSSAVFICTPCGIRFSSHSTLDAHQTYYCSHRHVPTPKATTSSGGGGGGESEPEDLKPVVEGREDASGGESSTGEPAPKSMRSGKQYRCPHCSYSADKKVSLNRHMRMHSSSPASQTGSVATEGETNLVDRYCQDCDIRFSSTKTFKAHKLHYCSTRHVMKSKPVSAPSSPSESRTTPTSPGASDTSNHPSREPPTQPFLALPTNPILIVPYSLFQGASILSGPAVMGLPAQDTACLLLPDGTLQPLAQGLLSHSRLPPQIPNEISKRQRVTSETIVKQPEDNRTKNGMSETPGAPLDLSVRTREEEGDLVIDMEEEDEKENRQSVDNQANIFPSPDPEDIICAPSIPLMLSTSSTCSSPSPAPPSPTLSSSSYSANTRKPQEIKRHRTDSQSSSPSPKSSPSGAKSPRRTPNGLPNMSEKVHKHGDSKRKLSAESVSPPKLDNGNNNLTLSSLLLAAAAQSQMESYPGKSEASGLPFPPDLVSHLSGSRLPGGKGKPIPAIPGLIPAAGRNLPLLLPKPPRTPADLIAPATILPLLTSEMALRIAVAAGGDSPVSAPQVLVKQGVSKCQECNIVFCKHENYIAHKKHYCSARQVNEPMIVPDDDVKPASPAMSSSPPNTASSPTSKDQSHSPVNPIPNSGASVSKPTLYQFICAACGIKFTSYDNLTAHQAYYCPKRTSTDSEKGSRRCQKCKMTVPMDHVCGGSAAWKCPCCHVVSPTASAAQKHMDTHTGVKAFLCTICRYKGNTLRGMRTHIRMHFEKRSTEIMEENYITCILEDGSGGSIELPAVDSEESHIRKTPDTNSSRNVNGDSVKVKEEMERRPEDEDDEEYIEVDEVKTESQHNSQDCSDSKSVMMRRGEGVVTNLARSVHVHR
ncbi:zinc finger protein ush isoform X1 [Homalodisca vitripennis]|uniref:zinc finger protein ush isoform X1 n=1 Tax=Homalodisca vitripennis TaxID=197043 RepID=UPI001EEA1AD3|nr:zinc finger protein ush isoform X1 [Homalodisca vitripennis]